MRTSKGSIRRRLVGGTGAIVLAAAGASVPLADPAEAALCSRPDATTTIPVGSATVEVYAGTDGASAAVCETSIGDAMGRLSVTTSGASVRYSSCTAYSWYCSSDDLVNVGIGRDAEGAVAVSHGGNADYEPVCSRPVLDTTYYGCTSGVGVGIATTGNASGPVAASGTGDTNGTVAVTGTGEPDGLVRASSDSASVAVPVEVPGAAVVAVKTLLPRCSHLMYLTGLGPDCPSWYPGYPSSGTDEDGYEGENCVAYNGMMWQTKDGGERVRFFSNYNQSSEVIDKQENHGALLRANKAKCGTQEPYTNGELVQRAYQEKVNWASSPELSSPYTNGSHDTWIATSGHDWYDGGSHWNVNTVTDICKNF